MDYFKTYFDYADIANSEPPVIFHRWTAISIISALLGRQCSFPFGHNEIFPNQYIKLMGSPGTRKSSAIKIGVKLLKLAGYDNFSSDKTSKERFLMDMLHVDIPDTIDDLLSATLDNKAESYICIGEFTDFIGQNNMEFVTMLTNLWDCPDKYTNPKIHGKSVEVPFPVVNILGGNTAQGFTLAFPPEALGNGFLSRLILIHGEVSGRKVPFPSAPDELIEAMLVHHLKDIKKECVGKFSLTKQAQVILSRMYNEEVPLEDNRFKHYATRRFIHLLKLSLVMAASDIRREITELDALKANTVLVAAERKMPKALGEFGKSKYSDLANSILDVLSNTAKPLNSNEVYKKISQDVGRMSDLTDLLKNLQDAGKVQLVTIKGKTGYITKHEESKNWDNSLVLKDYLQPEELL